MKTNACIGLLVLLTHLVSAQTDKKEYMVKVLHNLEQIKSATYVSESSSSAPGDTLAFRTYYQYVKEFSNVSDTFLYANFANFNSEDTSKLEVCYDGSMAAFVNWNEETIRIDSFAEYKKQPYRPVMTPFISNVKGIIRYALNNTDSTQLIFNDFGDSLQFSLLIFDRVLEIGAKPVFFKDYLSKNKGKVSRYDIWINKSNNLPYRMRRKMPHQTSFRTCSRLIINSKTDEEFIAAHFIPAGFRIVNKRSEIAAVDVKQLEGKPAPDWILKDINNKEYSLKDIKRKVLMLQFTGIGCGPCHASIPFLKNLTDEYRNRDFQFISIESWSSNVSGIKRYVEMNKINYLFLISNKEITKQYQVFGVPVFFILDKDRTIQKVISGYEQGIVDNAIKETLNKLL